MDKAAFGIGNTFKFSNGVVLDTWGHVVVGYDVGFTLVQGGKIISEQKRM